MHKQFKDFYNQYWLTRSDSGNRYRYSILLSWIKEGAKVLDIGCGDGYFAEQLAQRKNCTVTGMDISESGLKKASEKGIKTILASAEDPLPFADKEFDYAVAMEVLEHVPFSERALEEMVRLARTGVLVSIPNSAFWKYRLQLLSGTFIKQWLIHPMEHVRFWSLSDFHAMLTGMGLRARHVKAGAGKKYLRDMWPSMFAEQLCFFIEQK